MLFRASRFLLAHVCGGCLLAALLLSSNSLAWNAAGHMQIALLAYEKLSPPAQRALVELLKEHPRYQQDFAGQAPSGLSESERAAWVFAQAAVWPDMARSQPEYHHESWHYINHQLRLKTLRTPTECKATRVNKRAGRGDRLHLPRALAHNWEQLRTGTRPERALALSWVLHLVGDVHQPLHTVALHAPGRLRKGDRGGNEIELASGGNLHQLWDSTLGDSTRLAELRTAVTRLRSEVARDTKSVQGSFDDLVDGWVFEGCRLARERVYTPHMIEQAVAERRKYDLESEYLHLARLASRERAALAARRMAALLNLAAQSL